MDFTPRPGAAPRTNAVWRQARTEAMLLVRNGEQLLLALVIPVGLLVAGRWLGPRRGISFAELTGSVLALAVFSTAFTATAIATGFERRQGVLERLAATPLRRSGLVAGKAVAVSLVIVGQLVVLAGVAVALGWRPEAGPAPWAVAVVTTVLASTSFVALALALAGTLRAEATLALANLVHLAVAAGGGLLVGLHHYPPAWRGVVSLTPSAALGESLRALSSSGAPLASLPVTLIWALASGLIARKVFRWTS